MIPMYAIEPTEGRWKLCEYKVVDGGIQLQAHVWFTDRQSAVDKLKFWIEFDQDLHERGILVE